MCLVLYGSVSGNAADLADLVHDRLRRRRLSSIALKPFGETTIAEIQAHRHVFIICATTGQGALPENTQPLWSQLLRKSFGPDTFAGTQIYSFGLGSNAYPRFNWATRKIHARMIQLGAKAAVPRGEADELGTEPYEVVFDQWMSLALSQLDSELQITDAMELNELLPPLAPIAFSESGLPRESASVSTLQQRSTVLLPAVIASNDRITGDEHFQDVRHISLDVTPDKLCNPGDVICIYPANDERVVDAVLSAQDWTGLAHKLILPPAAEHYTPAGGWTEPLTLRNLLLWHVDLNSIPRRKFFAAAQHFCSDERQAERMQEFAMQLDDLFDYTTRPRRSIAEVIIEFDSLRIPTEYILELLPVLRPRQFSIASPPQSKTVDIAVAIVKYRTVLRRIRRGTCTDWLRLRMPGDKIMVSFEYNNFKIAQRCAGRPTILVATGTGIAPIRSLLLSGAFQGTADQPILFFGSRYHDQDFLFGSELQKVAHVIPAFSRENGGYVQNQIEKAGPSIPVEDAFIFVCGSSGPMPRAVREALAKSLVARGFDAEKSEQILALKEKTGLYMQETW